jgi:protein SCO1
MRSGEILTQRVLERWRVSTDRQFGWQVPALVVIVFVFGVLAGCRSSQKHYALRGRVLARSADQVTVNQQDIPGFMPAMTMPYPVKDPEALQQIQPGDSITAVLVVNGKKEFWLENVVVIASRGQGSVSTAADATAIEENGESLLGQPVPDVRLINQDGKTVHLSDFKGKAVLITFIYTRCPFPDFCPLLSNEFASIHRELLNSPEVYKKTHLMSISLDPANDSPPVLRKYALSYLHNDPSGFAQWDFVRTSPEDLATLAKAFELTYFAQDGLITHNMRTILVAPDGKVANVWDGSEWRQPELVDAMRRVASGQ